MKLNELKKLGKELSKRELVNVAGGDVAVSYQCADGLTGTLRGRNGYTDWDGLVDKACSGHGGGSRTTAKPTFADDEIPGRYLN